MNIIDAIILGIIQGLTEFLPISSSGHLVISKNFLNIDTPGTVMEIALHFGTMVAICSFFWKDIYLILKSIVTWFIRFITKKEAADNFEENHSCMLFLMIVLGTVPTVIIALSFEKAFESFFSLPILAGAMIVVTGCILWATKMIKEKNPGKGNVKFFDALMIGAVQGIAIIPGISRSGTTIATATFLGIKRELAAKFSFLLSVPVIFGATISKIGDISANTINLQSIIIGTIVATVVGFLSLLFLVNLIKKGKFYLFSYYCWGVGIIAVICFIL